MVDDRGVSELVGFALSFSIIVSAVAVVYIFGFGVLDDVRSQSDLQSADRGMQGVAVTFEELQEESVPGRSLELDVDGGTLRTVDGSVYVNVSTGSGAVNESVAVGGFEFAPTESPTRLVYQSGALFRTQRAASLVRHEPRFTCGEETALVSLVELVPERGPIDLTAAGTVELVGRRTSSRLVFPETSSGQWPSDGENVTVDVRETGRRGAWQQYFNETGEWEHLGDRYICRDVDNVQVRVTRIELRTIY